MSLGLIRYKRTSKNFSKLRVCVSKYIYNVYCIICILYIVRILYNIMLQNEEVCGNTIYSSSEASGVNHIIHRSRRLR